MIGTSCGGSTNRATTSTGVVGSAEPGPISNSIDDAMAWATMQARNGSPGMAAGGIDDQPDEDCDDERAAGQESRAAIRCRELGPDPEPGVPDDRRLVDGVGRGPSVEPLPPA